MSFIDTQKYPPSLLYLCMTIGPALILLGVLGNAKGKVVEAISVFGRVPLFYYILHFYFIHIGATIAYLLRGHSVSEGLAGEQGVPFKFIKSGEGFSLPVVYLVWIILILLLYPICRWYSAYKLRHHKWWLSYL